MGASEKSMMSGCRGAKSPAQAARESVPKYSAEKSGTALFIMVRSELEAGTACPSSPSMCVRGLHDIAARLFYL